MKPVFDYSFMERTLASLTKEGQLYEKLDNHAVQCFACAHRCKIAEGNSGICKVRLNRSGILRVPSGYAAGINCDPFEKKPFYHVLPGSLTLSFGMAGCNLHCAFCQNWISSQVLRDAQSMVSIREISARQIVDLAIQYKARGVTSTYNEPLITSEWAMEVFRLAKEEGLYTSYVSNGNATPEVIDYLKPCTDFYKVDLKSFQDKNYRKLGGTLKAVTDTIQLLHKKKFWTEIVTLVVPTLNDSEEELRDMARFIASISNDIPWHVTAFHENYQMTGTGSTPIRTLLRAGEIGKEEGLHFVYVGNIPGYAPQWENTYCPKCQTLLIERHGYRILQNRIKDGACPSCNSVIPGIWM